MFCSPGRGSSLRQHKTTNQHLCFFSLQTPKGFIKSVAKYAPFLCSLSETCPALCDPLTDDMPMGFSEPVASSGGELVPKLVSTPRVLVVEDVDDIVAIVIAVVIIGLDAV